MNEPTRAPSASASDLERERVARRTLGLAAAVTAAGVAISGTVDRSFGGVVVVVGWVLFAFALHAVGRAGSRR